MIAFCFLLYETIQHLQIWEDFFSQDVNEESSIYSHIKNVSNNTPSWIKKAKVRTVKTMWCGEGLIKAFNQMLKKALKYTDNEFFVLLSDSCIPLYPFKKTYELIRKDPRAKIFYQRYDSNVFEDRNDIYNSHLWVILNRKIAQDYIRLSDHNDRKAQKFVQKFRKLYRDNGVKITQSKPVVDEDNTWVGSCPDETYPINWLVELYGRTGLKKYVKNQMPTFSSWDFDKDPDHPEVFNIKTVKKAKKEICGTGHIFARKFTPDAADFIAMNCALKRPQIIVRKELVGRLGNQMFQYASALGIAYRKKGKVCVYTHEQPNELIKTFKGTFNQCNESDYRYKTVPEKGYGIYNIDRFLVDGSIEIKTDLDQGFLQSWKYFEPVKDTVRKLFKFKQSIMTKVKKYMEKLRSKNVKVIGIHVRRGDHISLGYLKFPPLSYFRHAKEYFKKKYKYKKVKFIVATNDKKWVTNHLVDEDTQLISHSKTSAEDMAILSLCDGVIMTIGTFGWWGAWLSNKSAVYYEKEFKLNHPINKGKINKDDYYLPTWKSMT